MLTTACAVDDSQSRLGMAIVRFSSDLARYTGEAEVEVEASNYRSLIDELINAFPELANSEIKELALALDGELIQEPLLIEFQESAELHFVPRLAAG